MSGCQVASAAERSVSRPPAAAADAKRYGRAPLLLLVLLYS